ncbi:MAG: alanine racemase [Xanthomonadaceae bacterium]|nr:alanine racemase [Xanthomonadaceae bacterium]
MRPAHALIDLDAFRRNYHLARALAGGKALAVIKADAYGHGAVACAQALADEADGFAVACIEEALTLRTAGIRSPILLLEGFFDEDELPLIAEHDLWCVVQAMWQVRAIENAILPRPLRIWLKLDTGMHRLGLSSREGRAAYLRLSASAQVSSLVMMSHFARGDELDCPRTEEQASTFTQITSDLFGETSLCNSAALLGWPGIRADWGRPGLMLYGVLPFQTRLPAAIELEPVMTLESKIIATRELGEGEPIGYSARFVTDRPTRVGVVAIGYADGYPQFAGNGAPVAIDGKPGRLIGRVSMDMLTVDLTDHPQAGLGSRVELWGKQISVAELAAHCHTSAYELLCGVKRVPLIHRG